MYRSGELLDTVDQSFAFLDNVSGAGSVRGHNPLPRQQSVPANVSVASWSTRERAKVRYWEPRYKTVRDMPGYAPERPLPRSMEWEQRRLQEQRLQSVRQEQWEREKKRRENERREAERREMERAREEQWRHNERMKEMELQRELEEARRLEEATQQAALEKEEERKLMEHARRLERISLGEDKVRRWEVHTAQNVNETEFVQEEKVRRWEVHPAQVLHYEDVVDEVSDARRAENPAKSRQDRLSNRLEHQHLKYAAPPNLPENKSTNMTKVANINNKNGSTLLIRTNRYLDAIERKEEGTADETNKAANGAAEPANNIPIPPPMNTSNAPSNIPVPPDMTGFETFRGNKPYIAPRIRDIQVDGTSTPPKLKSPQSTVVWPNQQDILTSRKALRPVEKRVVMVEDAPEPLTFKEKLSKIVQLQVNSIRSQPAGVRKSPSFLKKNNMENEQRQSMQNHSDSNGVGNGNGNSNSNGDAPKVMRRPPSNNRTSILPDNNNNIRRSRIL